MMLTHGSITRVVYTIAQQIPLHEGHAELLGLLRCQCGSCSRLPGSVNIEVVLPNLLQALHHNRGKPAYTSWQLPSQGVLQHPCEVQAAAESGINLQPR